MKCNILALTALAAIVILTGCSEEDPVGPDGITLDDLAGNWTATRFEYSQHNEGPAIPSVDLVAEGATVSIQIQSSGEFTLMIEDGPDGDEADSGMLGFDAEAEDFMWIVFDDEPNDELEFFFIVVSDDSFRLVDNTGEGEFDLDGDGAEERVRINSTWVR